MGINEPHWKPSEGISLSNKWLRIIERPHKDAAIISLRKQALRSAKCTHRTDRRDSFLFWDRLSSLASEENPCEEQAAGCKPRVSRSPAEVFKMHFKRRNPLMTSGNRKAPSVLPRSRESGWTTVAMTAFYWRLERLQELQHHTEREGEGEREREREEEGVGWGGGCWEWLGGGFIYLYPHNIPSPGSDWIRAKP